MNERPITDHGFFIGYYKTMPRGIAVFAIAVGAALVGALAASGFLLSYSADATDPREFAESAKSGVYQANPYPLIRIPPGAEYPGGHTLLLSGDGKLGAQSVTKPFEGQAVDISGTILKRGTIDMLIVDKIVAAATEISAPSRAVQLGHWRVSGEVCDGKCAGGAMRPGTGLAHKGCANLCIAGGLPPLLVMAQPVEGASFLLLANTAGGPLANGTWEDTVARPVTLEGDLERQGDLLILKTDIKKATFPGGKFP
jgi:hypothetical protein